MKYIAKAKWANENIEDKLRRGAEGIEIQLLNPEDEECLKDEYIIPESFRKYNIVCLHTPLMKENNFEIDVADGRKWLPKVVNLAEKIISYTNKDINIVCHMQQSKQVLMEVGLYDEIKEEFKQIALNHPRIIFNVENVIRLIGANDHVDFVKEINLPNVKTTLDVCHAMMTQDLTGRITDYGNYNHQAYKYVTVEDIFKANEGVCGWIHLNNSKDTGEGFGCGTGHGAIFDEEDIVDMQYLEYIYKLIKLYTPDATICLEVREDDFFNCTGYSKTRSACQRIFVAA